jgi:hypothetical protein
MERHRTPPNEDIEVNNVDMRILMLGKAFKDFKGRNSLNVLNTEKLRMEGITLIMLVATTIKSSQFQGSLR